MRAAPKSYSDLMTERDLQRSIEDTCRAARLLQFHVHDSRLSPEGWPDQAIVRGETLFLWELKTKIGRLSPAQARWLAALVQVKRVDARVIRPADLDWALEVLLGRKTP